MNMIVWFVIFFGVLTTIECQESNPCTPLANCTTLSWLNNITENAKFQQTTEIFGRNCNSTEQIVMVNCPEIEREDDTNEVVNTTCDPNQKETCVPVR